MATIEPKLFRSGDAGAPILNGNVGSLITLLDACLLTGYNSKSGLAITRNNNVATATLAAHGYARDQILAISGADQPEYNGEFRVLSVTTDTFTFNVDANSVTPATGTIAAKVAPLGWSKVFSGSNVAFYQSNNASSNKMFLKVVDDGTPYSTYSGRFASWRGYEEVLDINTAFGPFPRLDQTTHYIYKLYYNSSIATLSSWSLVGDSAIFYLANTWYENPASWSGSGAPAVAAFGDFISYRPGDNFNTITFGNYNTATAGNVSYDYACLNSQNSVTPVYGDLFAARQYNQTAQSALLTLQQNSINTRGLGDSGTGFPSVVDGSLIYGEILVLENSNILRGKMPGMYSPSHNKPINSPHTLSQQGTVIRNLGSSSKTYWFIPCRVHSGSANTVGQLMFDLTGPWR